MKLSHLVSIQLIRHYAVWLIRLAMAFVFGIVVEPDVFGAFITASFLSTGLWTLTDLGFKQRALQLPFQLDLSTQKSIHFFLGVAVSLLLLGISFEITFISTHTNRWILEFALITPLVASSTTSYVQLYWNKNIRFLAISDSITHLFLQPIALFLLWIQELHWALTVSFILPHIVHALLVLYRAQIEFSWNSDFLKQHLNSALHLGITDILTQFRTKGDTLLLAYVSNNVSVGIYNRGYALPHHMTNFIQAVLQPILVPHLSEKKEWIPEPLFYKGIGIISVLFFLFTGLLHFIIQAFWLQSWAVLLPFLPYFIIWSWSAFLSGLHESMLKSERKNQWVLQRQLLLTLFTIGCIVLFYRNLSLMISLIAFGKMMLVVAESFWIFSHSRKNVSAELVGCLVVTLTIIFF